MKLWSSCVIRSPCLPTARECMRTTPIAPPRSKLLLDSSVEGTAWPELRREDPEARAVADLVLLVPQVDDVESGLELSERGQREAMGDAEIGLLVGRHRRVIRLDDGAPQPAPRQEVQAEPCTEPRPEVGGARGGRDELIVVRGDVVIADEGEVVRAEERLRRLDALRSLPG